uniref:Uncharacterized protein n=1 Tax=Ditylum brightwellii TaxID=49249 RepID=A0A6U3RHP8_9STRA|eukprot:9846801-Ditylum_brightwellii.AAC.1
MLRRSLIVMSKQGPVRTTVRDPRKKKAVSSALVANQKEQVRSEVQTHQHPKPLPFEPNQQNQESLGLGSYVLAGGGMALGFMFVGMLFGG